MQNIFYIIDYQFFIKYKIDVKMMLNKNISFLLKKHRLKNREFGEEIGVTANVINSYKSGIATPKYETLLLISEKFQISCDDLLKKDLEKEAAKGMIAPTAEIILPLPYASEPREKYTQVSAEFKNNLLALMQHDPEVRKSVLLLLRDALNKE